MSETRRMLLYGLRVVAVIVLAGCGGNTGARNRSTSGEGCHGVKPGGIHTRPHEGSYLPLEAGVTGAPVTRTLGDFPIRGTILV